MPRVLVSDKLSPDGLAIGFLSESSGVHSLWLLDADGSRPRSVMESVLDFVWYRDSRRVIYTPATEQTHIRAVDLETGQDTLVLDEPHIELAITADGSALTYCSARSHFNMNLRLLRLEPAEDGLPRGIGKAIALTAHCLVPGTDARHVSMMIGTQHVDQMIVPTFMFDRVMGEIGCKIRCLTVLFDDDAILFVTVVGAPEPECTVFFVNLFGRSQFLYRRFNRAAILQ